jgi:hypothetical protein
MYRPEIAYFIFFVRSQIVLANEEKNSVLRSDSMPIWDSTASMFEKNLCK